MADIVRGSEIIERATEIIDSSAFSYEQENIVIIALVVNVSSPDRSVN